MKKLQDWPLKLAEFFESRSKTPFKWGQNDCITFPARALEAMTGHNYVLQNKNEGRGYTSKTSAEEMLSTHFDNKIENVFTHFLGEPRTDIAYAHKGDIVILEHNNEVVGGVIDNTGRRIVCAGPKGSVRLPKRVALMFWRVGE